MAVVGNVDGRPLPTVVTTRKSPPINTQCLLRALGTCSWGGQAVGECLGIEEGAPLERAKSKAQHIPLPAPGV